MVVVDLTNEKGIVSIRPDSLFIPASNQKLLSSAFALLRLGANYSFTTGVFMTDSGDLMLFGSYDPLLGDPVIAQDEDKSIYAELDQWAEAVQANLGQKPARDILIPLLSEEASFRHYDWPVKQNHTHYQAPVARLNFHNNCFGAVFDISDGQPIPRILPHSRFIQTNGRVQLGKKNLWNIRPNQDDSAVRLSGTVRGRTRSPLYVSANHPPLLLGRTFAERLVSKGVKLTGQVKTVDMKKVTWSQGQVLIRTKTPLAKVLQRANKDSLNIAAECMLLRAGDGTWPGSAAMMTRILSQEFDLPENSLVIHDGCGLSRQNRITAMAMAKILSGIASRPGCEVLINSLPRNGVDGTLRKRMKGNDQQGRVAAKTGYILRVSCLSGYILDKDDKPRFAFSFLVNDVPGRVATAKKLQDAVCDLLIDSIDQE